MKLHSSMTSQTRKKASRGRLYALITFFASAVSGLAFFVVFLGNPWSLLTVLFFALAYAALRRALGVGARRMSYGIAVAIVVVLAFGCGVLSVRLFTFEMRMHEATPLLALVREPVIGPVEVIWTLLVSILGLIILVRVVRRMALGQGIIPSWFEDKYSAVEFFASGGVAVAHLLLAVFVAGSVAYMRFVQDGNDGNPVVLLLLGMLIVFLYVTSVVGLEVVLAIASLAKGRLPRE